MAGTEYPDELTYSPYPIARYESGEKIIDPRFKSIYPDVDDSEVERKVEEEFYQGVTGSKTREYRPEIYEQLEEIARAGLMKKYNIDPEELQEGKSR